MNKITIEITGMKCPMCEAHTADALRKAFPKSKKIEASHKSGNAVILTEETLTDNAIRAALADTGYQVGDIVHETAAKKKGLFGLFG